MLSELAASAGGPVPVVDDTGTRRYFLIAEHRLAHLEAAAKQESDSTRELLRGLIAEGDASPDVPADEAKQRIMQMARDADVRHA